MVDVKPVDEWSFVVLAKAAQLVERGWCRHDFSKIGEQPCSAADPAAERFCLVGAVHAAAYYFEEVYRRHHLRTCQVVHCALGRVTALLEFNSPEQLYDWNDHPVRTQAQVVHILQQGVMVHGDREEDAASRESEQPDSAGLPGCLEDGAQSEV